MLCVGAIAAAAACTDNDPAGPTAGPLARGTWGGDSAGMIVDEAGVHVHIKCTLGDMQMPVVAGTDGRFDVTGSYVLRAYPVQIGPALPARFVGEVLGSRLRLTVTVDDTVEKEMVTMGPVFVQLGREPKLWPCPICRTGPEAWMAEHVSPLGLALLRPVVRYIVTKVHVISRRNDGGGSNARKGMVRP